MSNRHSGARASQRSSASGRQRGQGGSDDNGNGNGNGNNGSNGNHAGNGRAGSRATLNFDTSDASDVLAQLIRAIYTSDNQHLAQLIQAIRDAGSAEDVSQALQAALSRSQGSARQSPAYRQVISALSARNGNSNGGSSVRESSSSSRSNGGSG